MNTDQFRMLIRAKDYDATMAFWSGALGMEQIGGWDRDDSTGAILGTGGNAVVIVIGGGNTEFDFPAPEGVYAGIKVDDVDAWYERLVGTDVDIRMAPHDQMWGLRTMRLRDPNGVRVYLFTEQDQGAG